MKVLSQSATGNLTSSLSALALLVAGSAAMPAWAEEADAKALLKAMSDYLATQQTMSFSYDTDLEIVTPDLQKLAIASSGTLSVSRPDKLLATRTGGFADVVLTFDGKTLTALGKNANLYGQIELPGSIDQLIGVLRDELGRPLPGADLLAPNVYDELMGNVVDLKDLGSGVIAGVECDHLAGRAADVDWQIWIRQGDAPYPCRYVVTSKLVSGSPEYRIDITDWKAGADAASGVYSFENTTGATLVEMNDLTEMDDLAGIYAIGAPK